MLFDLIPIIASLFVGTSAAVVPGGSAGGLGDRPYQAQLARFGLNAIPSFDNETAIWSHNFRVVEENGAVWNVQAPRIYRNNVFDPVASQQKFNDVFVHGANSDGWKKYAMQVNAHDGMPIGTLSKRDFAAYLRLSYCNGRGRCTGFDLHYSSDGCQAAPGTNYIEVFYSQNASFIAWNRGGCTGHHTLFANGCDGGGHDVRDQTPGTNSFTFHIGCSF